MTDRDLKPGNVLPFKRPANDSLDSFVYLEGEFREPSDVRELVCLMTDRSDMRRTLCFIKPPDDVCAWEIEDADDVDRLAVHLIRLATEMRQEPGRKGPP